MQEVQEEPQGEKHIRATAKATGTPRKNRKIRDKRIIMKRRAQSINNPEIA